MAERDPAAAVTRRYDALLARRHLDSTVEVLAQATARDGLRYGANPVCRVLRPAFVSARQYDRVRRAARLVACGLFEASRRLLSGRDDRVPVSRNGLTERPAHSI